MYIEKKYKLRYKITSGTLLIGQVGRRGNSRYHIIYLTQVENMLPQIPQRKSWIYLKECL